jgi:plastocyanin
VTAGRRRVFGPACLLLAALLLAPPAAQAANRRIAIGHYQWSQSEVDIDLGEHVTWYWVGPDTMHSVTGTSVNDAGVDSDPGNNLPHHDIGYSFKHSFDQPGTYTFHCKLHPAVAGTVVVSANPGDPNTEVDPVPPSNVDLKPPYMSDVELDQNPFSRQGTTLRYGLNEAASLDAEYYRLPKHRAHRSSAHRTFAGWRIWPNGHVGYNHVKFATGWKHFTPRPGHYVALLRATDHSRNESRARRLEFTIR